MPSLDSYYQPDFSHRNKPKASRRSTAPQYDIGLDGVPVRTSGNPVRPTGGEPTAYAQHGGGTEYYDTADGRSVYKSNGVEYDRATGQQVFTSNTTGESVTHDGAFSLSKDGGPNGYKGTNSRNTDNQIVSSGTQVWKVPDSLNNGGGGNRNSERTNAKGVVQKGTDMSRSFNDLLATTNTSGYQPFSSNQLPTTGANPFSAQPPKTQSFNTEAESVTGNSLANFGGDGSAAFASSRETTGNDTFNPNAARIEGGSDRKKGGSLADALSDTAGINSYMSKFSSGDRERAANRAFLDTEGSMEGLRAKEAVNNVVYAQGQHYVPGESADSPAVAINRSAARDISNGSETASGASQKAQDLLAKKTADVVAATKQAPTLLEDGAKNQAFQQDKPIASKMPSDIGGKTEYYSNNDNVTEPFGGPKGYKSGFKRIDTSMTSPFG
jgi:hypothetical protein